MSLPFVDPFSCAHEVERLVSQKSEPVRDMTRRISVFRCANCGALIEETSYEPWTPGEYIGPNFKRGDYYVREVRQSGRQRRSVYLEVVGTGRVIRVGRKAFERERRAA